MAAAHAGDAEDAAAFAAERREFAREGLVFPVRGLLSPAALDAADALLSSLVAARPAALAPEDLLNLHLTVPAVLALCRAPRALALARALLGTRDVSVFTSRVLCKLPGGREIPWHQDSLYWPLEPPGAPRGAGPAVASMWLALDDVRGDGGVMEVLPFSAAEATRGRSAAELVRDAGGATDGFDNFNLSLDSARLGVEGLRRVEIARGEAEWHSAFVAHRSDANASARRRLAWIVRYVPTGTRVVAGVRGAFGADYPLVPVCGRGAPPEGEDAPVALPSAPAYAPCFGAAVAALKK